MWIDEFRKRVEAHPGRTAIVARDQRYSYQELWDRSAAAGLATSQAQPGPRHLIAESDSQRCLESIIGAWIHGKVPVVIAPDMPTAAMEQVRALIASPPPSTTHEEEREALILATSGSTQLPKVVVHAHRTLTVGIAGVTAWYGLPEDSQLLIPVAMHLSRSLSNNALLGLRNGWTLHLFQPGTPGSVLLAYIRANGITVFSGPPSLFRMFFQYAAGASFPSVQFVSTGAEPVPRTVVEQMRKTFPNAKCYISYGATEAGTRITALSMDDPRSSIGGVGAVVSYLEARIVPVPGVPAPAGELLLRGATICLGYLQPDGSYVGLDAEGFHHTGDLVRPDLDGCLFHLGRAGGLVKVGGLLVHPNEVELALRSLPGVADAMCWPEPHHLLGNVIAAQVVAVPGATLDPTALRRACGDLLQRHKVPRTVTIVAELPKAPSGKRLLQPTAST